MSKRAELHKEYYKQFGTRKGITKVSEHYVKWLEDQVLELRTENKTTCKCTERIGETKLWCCNHCGARCEEF